MSANSRLTKQNSASSLCLHFVMVEKDILEYAKMLL